MTLKGLPAALITFLLGFVLGCIPGLNAHLHWNLWYVVPISGLVFGLAAGGVQFWYCYKANEEVSKAMMLCLILAAVVGYASVDYGIYRTTSITLEGAEGIEDGTYPLSALMSFTDFMRLNLGSSSVKKDYGAGEMEMGAAATTISYFADLSGAALGTLGALVLAKKKYPYCRQCRKYKRREREYVIQFAFEESLADALLGGVRERIAAADYLSLIAYVRQLAQTHTNSKGDMRVSVDHRLCPGCSEATLLGKVERRKGREWHEISTARFEFTQKAQVA
ncbi:MAG: hypothetical protein IH624_14900 [Phycisphaerae bacterium]|nr:hypothetical protein [Phycisphaerae bacterium]